MAPDPASPVPADGLTAAVELERMRQRYAWAADRNAGDYEKGESLADTPLLVAAIEAALKLAGEWAAEAKRIDGIFAGDEDPWPRTVGGMRAEAFESCAAKVREAIAAALTGLWRLPGEVEKAVRAQLGAQSKTSTEEERCP